MREFRIGEAGNIGTELGELKASFNANFADSFGIGILGLVIAIGGSTFLAILLVSNPQNEYSLGAFIVQAIVALIGLYFTAIGFGRRRTWLRVYEYGIVYKKNRQSWFCLYNEMSTVGLTESNGDVVHLDITCTSGQTIRTVFLPRLRKAFNLIAALRNGPLERSPATATYSTLLSSYIPSSTASACVLIVSLVASGAIVGYFLSNGLLWNLSQGQLMLVIIPPIIAFFVAPRVFNNFRMRVFVYEDGIRCASRSGRIYWEVPMASIRDVLLLETHDGSWLPSAGFQLVLTDGQTRKAEQFSKAKEAVEFIAERLRLFGTLSRDV